MSLSSGSPGAVLFSMPASPALRRAAEGREGGGGGGGGRRPRGGALPPPRDVPQRRLAQAGIKLSGEQRLVLHPQALVGVHPGAVVLEERLGHEGVGLAGLVGGGGGGGVLEDN